MMGRYFSPFILLAAGAFVLWFNHSTSDRVLILPLIDTVYPAVKGKLSLQGDITAGIFFTLGGLWLMRSLWLSLGKPKDPHFD